MTPLTILVILCATIVSVLCIAVAWCRVVAPTAMNHHPPLHLSPEQREQYRVWRHRREHHPNTEVLDRAGAHNRIVMTYKNLDNIPPHVYAALDRYAPHHIVALYDDDRCLQFLREYYPPAVAQRFTTFRIGAHKADLFRYCYLRVHGGIYMDIKTVLTRPVQEMFPDKNAATTAVTLDNMKGGPPTEVYQGVIATPPGNAFFDDLVQHAVETPNWVIDVQYRTLIRKFGERLATRCNVTALKPGDGYTDRVNQIPWVLWGEQEAPEHVCGGTDRYGYCLVLVNRRGDTMARVRDISFAKTW